MTPLELAGHPDGYTDVVAIKRLDGCTTEQAHRIAAANRRHRFYLNDVYQVCVSDTTFPGVGPMLHLSIKRRDKEPIHDWRDLQAIKNQLAGPECEGVEMYPAESRLVDEANQYHLFVFVDPTIRFPIGMTERSVGGPEEAAAVGAKQRPFEENKA